jgi:hypothetical protein
MDDYRELIKKHMHNISIYIMKNPIEIYILIFVVCALIITTCFYSDTVDYDKSYNFIKSL